MDIKKLINEFVEQTFKHHSKKTREKLYKKFTEQLKQYIEYTDGYLPDIGTLRNRLNHEMQTVQSLRKQQKVETNTDLAVSYLLTDALYFLMSKVKDNKKLAEMLKSL